uniref:Genome polyprotein n=1 Tax=Caliciviridae sp. TaxID=1916234 RepID=A0A8K1JED6_9CALI|nr:MAG: polyprotein [Caliciviridae sp.]
MLLRTTSLVDIIAAVRPLNLINIIKDLTPTASSLAHVITLLCELYGQLWNTNIVQFVLNSLECICSTIAEFFSGKWRLQSLTDWAPALLALIFSLLLFCWQGAGAAAAYFFGFAGAVSAGANLYKNFSTLISAFAQLFQKPILDKITPAIGPIEERVELLGDIISRHSAAMLADPVAMDWTRKTIDWTIDDLTQVEARSGKGLQYDRCKIALTTALQLKQTFNALAASLGRRIRPVVIMLSGPPGIGKTTLAHHIAKHLSSQIGDGTVGVWNNQVDHYDSYSAPTAIVWEDFGKSDITKDLVDLQNLADTAPLTLNCDRIEKKGTLFVSRVVVITTNMDAPVPPDYVNAAACLRRIDFLVDAVSPTITNHITGNPGKPIPKALYQLDYSHILMSRRGYLVYNKDGTTLQGGKAHPTYITLNDLLQFSTQQAKTYAADFSLQAGELNTTKSIIFVGPPGCGKTQLARTLASKYPHIRLMDDVTYAPDRWIPFKNAVKAVESGGPLILATANSQPFKDQVDKDGELGKALMRKLDVYEFSFARKNWLERCTVKDINSDATWSKSVSVTPPLDTVHQKLAVGTSKGAIPKFNCVLGEARKADFRIEIPASVPAVGRVIAKINSLPNDVALDLTPLLTFLPSVSQHSSLFTAASAINSKQYTARSRRVIHLYQPVSGLTLQLELGTLSAPLMHASVITSVARPIDERTRSAAQQYMEQITGDFEAFRSAVKVYSDFVSTGLARAVINVANAIVMYFLVKNSLSNMFPSNELQSKGGRGQWHNLRNVTLSDEDYDDYKFAKAEGLVDDIQDYLEWRAASDRVFEESIAQYKKQERDEARKDYTQTRAIKWLEWKEKTAARKERQEQRRMAEDQASANPRARIYTTKDLGFADYTPKGPAWADDTGAIDYGAVINWEAQAPFINSVSENIVPLTKGTSTAGYGLIIKSGFMLCNRHVVELGVSARGHPLTGLRATAHDGTDVVLIHAPFLQGKDITRLILESHFPRRATDVVLYLPRTSNFLFYKSAGTSNLMVQNVPLIGTKLRAVASGSLMSSTGGTIPGDCGSIYLVLHQGALKIFALHSAASPNGKESFASTIPTLSKLGLEGGNATYDGFPIIARVPVHPQVEATHFHRSYASALLPPETDTHAPAVIGMSDTRIPHPPSNHKLMMAQLKKYAQPRSAPPDHAEVAAAFSTWLRSKVGANHGMWDYRSAFLSLDPNTSCGFPIYGPKTKHLDSEGLPASGTELHTNCTATYSAFMNCKVRPPVYTAALKDELVPTEKVYNREKLKKRLLWGAPADFSLVCAAAFGPSLLALKSTHHEHPIKPGICCLSSEWHMLAMRHREMGLSMDMDFSSWDSSVSREVIRSAAHVLADLAGTPQAHVVADAIAAPSALVVGDVVLEVAEGLPSGVPATAQINSIAHTIYLLCAIRQLARGRGFPPPSVSEIMQNTEIATYGDDGLYTFSPLFQLFVSPESLAAVFTSWGLRPTPASKTGQYKYTVVDDMTFLKRGFSPLFGQYVGPLEPSSLYRQLHWVRGANTKDPHTTVPPHDQRDIQLMAAVLEASLHGEEFFNEFQGYVEIVCNSEGIEFDPIDWRSAFHMLVNRDSYAKSVLDYYQPAHEQDDEFVVRQPCLTATHNPTPPTSSPGGVHNPHSSPPRGWFQQEQALAPLSHSLLARRSQLMLSPASQGASTCSTQPSTSSLSSVPTLPSLSPPTLGKDLSSGQPQSAPLLTHLQGISHACTMLGQEILKSKSLSPHQPCLPANSLLSSSPLASRHTQSQFQVSPPTHMPSSMSETQSQPTFLSPTSGISSSTFVRTRHIHPPLPYSSSTLSVHPKANFLELPEGFSPDPSQVSHFHFLSPPVPPSVTSLLNGSSSLSQSLAACSQALGSLAELTTSPSSPSATKPSHSLGAQFVPMAHTGDGMMVPQLRASSSGSQTLRSRRGAKLRSSTKMDKTGT